MDGYPSYLWDGPLFLGRQNGGGCSNKVMEFVYARSDEFGSNGADEGARQVGFVGSIVFDGSGCHRAFFLAKI